MRTPWWKAFHRGTWKPCIWDTNSCGRINPQLIHLSITGFGRTGRKRAYHSCDSVQAAFGGQMHVSGIPTGKPLKLFGPQSCYAASLFGANAVLLSLRQRNITGRGRHIDLSIQEAVASTLDHVMIDYFQDRMTPGGPTDDHQPESFFTFPCKDGHIEMPLLRNGDTLLELVNSETNAAQKLGAEWKDTAYRKKHYRLFHTAVTGWTARHTKRELFHLGQAMGFPWAPVESPEEVLRSPQLKARRFFARTEPAGKRRSLSVPGLPYRFSCLLSAPSKTRAVDGRAQPPGPENEFESGNPRLPCTARMMRALLQPVAEKFCAEFACSISRACFPDLTQRGFWAISARK